MAFRHTFYHLGRRNLCVRRNVIFPSMARGVVSKNTSDAHQQRLCRLSSTSSEDGGNSDLPYHEVHPMPSLSRSYNTFTEYGIVSKWNINEGQQFMAGEPICEIETDQGMFELDAQEDGFMARHLVHAVNFDAITTTSVEDGKHQVKVGVPIFETVEDAEDVEIFRDFVPSSTT